MRISIIVAATENGVIGRNGDLSWRIPTDMRRFRARTMGKPLIMGRKQFQSMPRALEGRDNIVISRTAALQLEGAETVTSLEAAVALATAHAARRSVEEIMVIGGGEIYAAALPLADRVYLTRIHTTLDGDTRFPELAPEDWMLVSRTPLERGPKDEHAATELVFERIGTVSGVSAPKT